MTTTPAGWFAQPDGTERFWDGAQWTDQTRLPHTGGQGNLPAAYGAPNPGAGYGAPAAGRVVLAKSPAIAAIASAFIPGLGSMLNGRIGKGIFIMLGYALSWLLTLILIGYVGLFIFWIWGVVDAYTGARRWNARHGIIS